MARDERDFGTTLSGDPGDGVSLLTGTAVSDKAHRVQGFTSAAGGDQDPYTGQIVRQRVRSRQQ
ncbi:Uncharacterised protein [Mycobacteroides abscessus]|nr:Uncharacterised protein [Mycobacteroides abscessus]